MSKRPGDPGYSGTWCIHFRDQMRNETCEAGVAYDTFRTGGTPFKQQPCFLDKGVSRPDALPCEHLRRPTPEEIAAHEEWADFRLDKLRRVMTAIQPWRKEHKGQSFREMIECPECKGRLHLSIAAYNGHVHATCETPGCVSWVE
jgi:hypothetical protein